MLAVFLTPAYAPFAFAFVLMIHGGPGGAETPAGGGNLADAAVADAMRYRVGGPLIDGLMAALGMTGAGLDGLLAGAGVTPAPATVAKAPIGGTPLQYPAANGTAKRRPK